MVDFNEQNISYVVDQLIKTTFKRPWDFRVEVTGAPSDFDFYIKDITYGPIEIKTEEEEANFLTFTYPTGAAPVGVSITVRDNEDARIYKWLNERTAKIINSDGTVNLPKDYLMEFRLYSLKADKFSGGAGGQSSTSGGGNETPEDTWEVFITQVGDITRSLEQGNEWLTFPISLMQFSNLGYQILNFEQAEGML